MKTKLLFIFIVLLFFAKQSNAQYDKFRVVENSITIADCNVWEPLEITFEVSGVPSTLDADYNLKHVLLNANFNAPVNVELSLISPQGTTVRIGSSTEGSWPNIDVNSTMTIASDICSSDPHNANTTGTFIKVKPLDDYSAFEGENPNGTWTFKICSYNNEFTLHFLSFVFASYSPAPEISSTTNATDCQSNDGTVELKVPLPKCSPSYQIDGNTKFVRFISIDGTNWEEKNKSNITISNLSAGEYTVYVTRDNGTRQPDPNYVTPVDFTIEADNTTGAGVDGTCPPLKMVEFDQNNMASFDITPPTYRATCGATNANIPSFQIRYPDGSIIPVTYDPTQTYTFSSSQSGLHYIDWDVEYEIGGLINNDALCTQEVLVAPNSIIRFNSPLCDDTNPQVVTNCQTGNDAQFHSINVSGLPSVLSPEFGLRGIHLDLNIPGPLSSIQPYVDIVDPTGVRHRLFNPSSFPQFDPATQKFIINFTSCNNIYFKRASDDIPFVENGTYKPMENNNLNEVNLRSINPNGEWKLQVCANQEWSINCFRLDFGGTCATIDQSSIQINSCGSTPFVQIWWGDINIPSCDDQNGDGIPDYYISLDGGPATTWDQANNLKMETTPGHHTLEFGTLSWDDRGNTHFECRQFFNIYVPGTDIEAPVISDCPPDQLVNLDANGVGLFSIVVPTATDNCSISKVYFNAIYTDGATDIDGKTVFNNIAISPGITINYNIKGEGKLVYDFIFEDAAGNKSTCTSTVSSISNPCANDTQAPVIDCPLGQTILLDDNNTANYFYMTDPEYTDNCKVASKEVVVQYLDGATSKSGKTYFKYNDILPKKTYKYSILGTGRVQFVFTVIDKSGNSSKCQAIVTAKKKTGPCAHDNTPPQLTNCLNDFTVELDSNTNSALFKHRTPDISDECGIASTKIVINYLDGATGPKGELFRTFNNIGGGLTSRDFKIIGSGRVLFDFIATDPSGNSSNCTTVITSKKASKDVVFNMGSGCAVPGLKTIFPVRVTNFKQVGAFSFDLVLPDKSELSFLPLENINLKNISYNILSNGDLRISWYDQGGDNVTLNDFTRIFSVAIQASNKFNKAIKVQFKDLTVLSDIGNNASFEGGDICVQKGVSPAGNIKNSNGAPQSDVNVNLTSGNKILSFTKTDKNGKYSFPLTNKSEWIVPFKNDEITKGVDIIDVAKIRRHFLETNKLTNQYNQIAADVNKDGRINILDVAFTNRVFLKKKNSFPNNTSWRYFPAMFDIKKNPLDPDNPQFIKLETSGLDYNHLNFIVVKTGDVDNSSLGKFRHKDINLRASIKLLINDTVVDSGEKFSIPIYVSGKEPVSLFSFTMEYDTTLIQLEKITSNLLPGFSEGNYNDIKGNVLVGWDHPNGDSIIGNGVFLKLIFSAKLPQGASKLKFSNVKLYNTGFELYDVNMKIGKIEFKSIGSIDLNLISDLTIWPNPFNKNVLIDVALKKASKIKVTLIDTYGRIIESYDSNTISDTHKAYFNNIQYKGVILVKVEGEHFQKVYKLISQ